LSKLTSSFRVYLEIALDRPNFLIDMLPSDDAKEERWNQIRKNIRYRSLGFCGSGHGYNLLHAAAEFGQEDTVRYLLNLEEDSRLLLAIDDFVNVTDNDGNTPLHFAAKGRLEVVKLLLVHGADPNIKTKQQKTPLIIATQACSVEIVRLLLDHGANPAATDEQGWAALHHAIFIEGQGEIMELLLETGIDVDSLGRLGRTPLHCAAVRGREDIVLLLLEKGANASIKDGHGESPLDLAERGKKERVVRILRTLM
jgi:ankyrin repeat protein